MNDDQDDLLYVPLTSEQVKEERQREKSLLSQTLMDWEPLASTDCAEGDLVMEQRFEDAKHGIYQAHDGTFIVGEPYDRDASRQKIAEENAILFESAWGKRQLQQDNVV